jgi:MerR family transcriptional regulator, light-induced transcriptional regulator
MDDGHIFDTGLRVSDQSKTAKSTARHERPSLGDARDRLATVVESQIIPQLLAATRPRAPARTHAYLTKIAKHNIAEFTELVLADNTLAIGSYLDLCRAKGISVEAIYLELLTGTARRLGELWGSDECNFCEVGLAVWRIQKIMYDLRPAFFAEGSVTLPSGYRVLLAPLASEQHTLGIMMAAEFFRRAGWDVSSELPDHNDGLVDAVRQEYVDLVGISVSSDSAMRELAATISAVRAASINRRLTIMVGGWLFLSNPEKAVAMGADFSTPDVRDAIILGEKYVSQAWDTRVSPHLSPHTSLNHHL